MQMNDLQADRRAAAVKSSPRGRNIGWLGRKFLRIAALPLDGLHSRLVTA
jgi:hypothetical protein